MPNVVQVARDIESYGAQGITVHPRPDERHIRYSDVRELSEIITTEFNIEGNPRERKFVDLVLAVKPAQVTLVPDSTTQLTSDHGWDTVANKDYLTDVITMFREAGIRTSVFVDPHVAMIEGAAATGTDRVELYTESYAAVYRLDRESAILPFIGAAEKAISLGLGLNAGHDLNRDNLKFFKKNILDLSEVSIGHALIADALCFGFENTIQMYLRELK